MVKSPRIASITAVTVLRVVDVVKYDVGMGDIGRCVGWFGVRDHGVTLKEVA